MYCCPPGSEPALSTDYVPKGTEITLNGLKCYEIGAGTKAIMVYYDIFGFNGGRIRAICDQLADAGYLVVMPDYYNGDAWPADKSFDTLMDWVKNFPWEPLIKDAHVKVMAHLKSKNVQSVGCLGFCAGAFTVFHVCQSEEIKCGASCHPSVQLCGLFGEKQDTLAELVKSPQLIYPAGGDPDFYKPGGSVYEILKKKFGDEFEYKEFPEMNHGWVPRADLSKPEACRDVKLAMDGVTKFFKKHL